MDQKMEGERKDSLIISKYLHVIRRDKGKKNIAYHRLFGNFSFLNDKAMRVLDMFSRPMGKSETSLFSARHHQEIRWFYNRYYLVDTGWDEREEIKYSLDERERLLMQGQLLGGVQLSVSDMCISNCSVCFCAMVDRRGGKRKELREEKSNKEMSFETAVNVIDTLIRKVKENGRNTLAVKFFGKEPLINWPLISRLMAHYEGRRNEGIRIQYMLVTNAIPVTEAMARLLSRHNVRTTVCIKELAHPLIPAQANGMRLLADQQALHVISASLTGKNFETFDRVVIDLGKSYGAQEVRVSIGIQENAGVDWTDSERIAKKLLDTYLYGKSQGIAVTGYWHNSIIEILSTRKTRTDKRIEHGVVDSCAATGYQINVEPSGDIFPCRLMAMHLGHISDLDRILQSSAYKHLGMRTYTNVAECRDCVIEGFCQGECLGRLEDKYKDIYRVDKTCCDIYKNINNKILSLM
ncbi:MAG: radical SAM protein [Candidatus Omnitrophota bacterium]